MKKNGTKFFGKRSKVSPVESMESDRDREIRPEPRVKIQTWAAKRHGGMNNDGAAQI
jgi:hypothetical protein